MCGFVFLCFCFTFFFSIITRVSYEHSTSDTHTHSLYLTRSRLIVQQSRTTSTINVRNGKHHCLVSIPMSPIHWPPSGCLFIFNVCFVSFLSLNFSRLFDREEAGKAHDICTGATRFTLRFTCTLYVEKKKKGNESSNREFAAVQIRH